MSVKRYKMPLLDDPLAWPRDLRKSGTEVVLASDYDALAAEFKTWMYRQIDLLDSEKDARIATLEAHIIELRTQRDEWKRIAESGLGITEEAAAKPSSMDHGGIGQVGCTRDDGLLNIHGESDTCEVCMTPDILTVEEAR